MLMHSLFRQKL